jgi:site-specific recombinase
MAGIAVIGLLNFGVSFILALRAREVERRDQLRLLRAVLARFAAKPAEFLAPS